MRRMKQIVALMFALCVLVLLVVQLALTTPQAREALAEQLSGAPAGNSVAVGVTLGELTLTLDGVTPSNNIKVLQNGIPISVFNQQTITVLVEDNSLIEIDGSSTKNNFRVLLDSYSDNVELFKNTREIVVQGNIVILDRVFISD